MPHVLENIQTIIQNNHSPAFLAVFVGGLISAASPCVLAAIPLIIGYVGGYSEGDRKKAAVYSLVFILGLSITFTVLGAPPPAHMPASQGVHSDQAPILAGAGGSAVAWAFIPCRPAAWAADRRASEPWRVPVGGLSLDWG